jgi:hypothetical protein
MNPAPTLSCQAIFFHMQLRQVDQFAQPAVGWALSQTTAVQLEYLSINQITNSLKCTAAELCSECAPIHQRCGGSLCRVDPWQHGARQQTGAWCVHLDRSQIPRGGSCDIGTLPIAGKDFMLVQVGKVYWHIKALRSGCEDSIYSIGTCYCRIYYMRIYIYIYIQMLHS